MIELKNNLNKTLLNYGFKRSTMAKFLPQNKATKQRCWNLKNWSDIYYTKKKALLNLG